MVAAIKSKCLGVILAGGKSVRMGQPDKFLLNWQGRPLLQHCLERALPQVDRLVISANGDPARLAVFQQPVLADRFGDFAGPLAGILTAMDWSRENGLEYEWLASFASDTPLFPQDLVAAMARTAAERQLQTVYASAHGEAHYVFSLWSLSIYPLLLAQYQAGERSLWRAMTRFRHGPYPCLGGENSFFNVNTPADLSELFHKPEG